MGHAPDSLVALVPVLDRPANVAPLVASWANGGAPGLLLFLTSPGDEQEVRAIDAADGNWLECESVPWPTKINEGVAATESEWVLLAADDVEFAPGWWEATASLRAQPEVGVIGTNDLANPRVMAGDHATHWLMRRSYITECGTIDAPGLAVHPGYRHWYVDDECHWTAKSRGAWAFCAEAHIKHHHPYFDERVAWDDTYALGESKTLEDQALFVSRAHLFGVTVG